MLCQRVYQQPLGRQICTESCVLRRVTPFSASPPTLIHSFDTKTPFRFGRMCIVSWHHHPYSSATQSLAHAKCITIQALDSPTDSQSVHYRLLINFAIAKSLKYPSSCILSTARRGHARPADGATDEKSRGVRSEPFDASSPRIGLVSPALVSRLPGLCFLSSHSFHCLMQSPSIISYRFPLLYTPCGSGCWPHLPPPSISLCLFYFYPSLPPYLFEANKLSPTWILIPIPHVPHNNIVHITLLFSFLTFSCPFSLCTMIVSVSLNSACRTIQGSSRTPCPIQL